MKMIKRMVLVALAILLAALYSYGVWPRAIYNTDIGANSYENTGALSAGKVLTQKFVCTDTGMCGLKLKLTKQESQTIGNYEWILENVKTSKEIANGVIDEVSTENREFVSASAQKRGNIELNFDRQEDSKGQEYVLTIQSSDVEEGQTMAVYMTQKGKSETEMTLAGENVDRASVIKVEYKRFNVENFIVFLGIVVYLVLFVKFMYKLFR